MDRQVTSDDATLAAPVSTTENLQLGVGGAESPTIAASPQPTELIEQEGDGGERRTLGRYVLLQQVGAGGMGEVWRAHDPQLHRTVAVKLLHRTTSDVDRQRFRREARIAASLDHPAIVRTLDADIDERQAYLVQEFIEGYSLSVWARQHRPDPDSALRLLRTLAEGVAYAHARDVIHRDLKPANVLLDGNKPKLTDFGLARRMDEHSELSLSGQLLGTPRYMAPEVIRDPKQVSVRSDVYGLGTILYELLTGQPPISGDNLHHILFRVCEGDVVPVREMNPEVPSSIAAIVMKCLARDPADRYASAEALAADIDRVHAGQPITALTRTGEALIGLIGEQLGPFTFEGRVTSAPQGVVYRAFDRAERRRKTVLVMRPMPREDRGLVEERLDKVQQLDHHALLVPTAIHWSEAGHPLLELPVERAESLEDVLREVVALEQELATEVIDHLLQGLSAAHAADVVHGRLTPGSLVLTETPSGQFVKLIGTGLDLTVANVPAGPPPPVAGEDDLPPIDPELMAVMEADADLPETRLEGDEEIATAELIEPGTDSQAGGPGAASRAGFSHHGPTRKVAASDDVTLADTGAPRLPPAGAEAQGAATEMVDMNELGAQFDFDWWSAPEYMAGERPDPRSDLYAVGVVMYQLLAGVPPFDDWHHGPPDAASRGRVIPLTHARPGYPFHPAIEDTVRRAIARAPERRFQDAEAFRGALPAYRPPSIFFDALRLLPFWIALLYLLFGPVVSQRPGQAPHLQLSPFAEPGPGELRIGRGALQYVASLTVGRLPAAPEAAVVSDETLARAKKPTDTLPAWRDTLLPWCVEHGRKRPEPDIERGMVRITGSMDGQVHTFFVDQHEVTRGQYADFLASIRTRKELADFPAPPGWTEDHAAGPRARLPVVNVSWWEAEAYAAWAGKRLPSDRQWLWIAGETTTTPARKYPWSQPQLTRDHAVYHWPDDPPSRATFVGAHPAGATPHKVHDLAGNVWEWLSSAHPDRPLADHRLMRGGSWRSGAEQLEVAHSLDAMLPAARRDDVGFRCVYLPGKR